MELLQPSYALVQLGAPEPHVASGGNMRELTATPTAKPWFGMCFLFVFTFWLNAFELQMFHSLVYRVAALTMSHFAFRQATS